MLYKIRQNSLRKMDEVFKHILICQFFFFLRYKTTVSHRDSFIKTFKLFQVVFGVCMTKKCPATLPTIPAFFNSKSNTKTIKKQPNTQMTPIGNNLNLKHKPRVMFKPGQRHVQTTFKYRIARCRLVSLQRVSRNEKLMLN